MLFAIRKHTGRTPLGVRRAGMVNEDCAHPWRRQETYIWEKPAGHDETGMGTGTVLGSDERESVVNEQRKARTTRPSSSCRLAMM